MVFGLAFLGTQGAELRPYATVLPLSLSAARWTHGFWADRLATCRTQTVPGMWRLMSSTNYSQYLENFRVAAGLSEGRYRGAPFNDGDFYKWLESARVLFGTPDDAELRPAIDEAVETIVRAQRPDGYPHTQVLVRALKGEPDAEPFQDRNNFELYNLGHLMTTACVHHRVTGETQLLDVARRAADFLDRAFRGVTPEAARASVCPSHVMGLVDLYRETHEPHYLGLAKKMFALRSQITDGGDDNQDRIPFEQQTEVVGHAVRGNYLYAGATDLFMETGDVIDLDLPMETRLIEAHPLVEETSNELAVQRGPLVYCLESVDLPEDTGVLEITLPPDLGLLARYDRRLLDGVVALEGTAELRRTGDWNGLLYRALQPSTPAPVKIRLVPYYAWGNRGEGEMTVWMARAR